MLRAAQRPGIHLIHPGAGRSDSYAALVAAVPSHWTITASNDVGPVGTVSGMARLYLAELLRHVGVPDVIGGWSMGGLVAFEVIHQLRRGGASRLPALFLIDSPPPVRHGADSRPEESLREFAQMLGEAFELSDRGSPELDGDDDVCLRALAAALRRAGHIVELDWLAGRLAEYRRHRAAVAGYSCQDPLDVPALLVAGDLFDSYVERWRTLLRPDAVVTRLAGGHFDLLGPPLVGTVADLLAELVARAAQPEGVGP